MLRWFGADLHIHTVLSPCAELDMGPANIVRTVRELGLDIIAITDHNAAANVKAVMERAGKGPPAVIPGMEVQTREEVHLLCLFPGVDKLEEFATFIRERLPPILNRPDIFGDQVVVNGSEEILYFEETLLASSVRASLEEVAAAVMAREGLVIPAHVDRPSFSLLANLGFIPLDLPVAALEVARPAHREALLAAYPELAGYSLVTFSDAHSLSQLRRKYRTYFYLQEPTLDEIREALQGRGGRKVVIREIDDD